MGFSEMELQRVKINLKSWDLKNLRIIVDESGKSYENMRKLLKTFGV